VSNLLLKIEHFYPADSVSAEKKSFLIISSFVPFFFPTGGRPAVVHLLHLDTTKLKQFVEFFFSKNFGAKFEKVGKNLQKLRASRRRE
jgi:hypothetical protein